MSIVPLVKVTLYGHLADKQAVLAGLQELGCVHLVSLNPQRELPAREPSPEARAALRFLQRCPRQRRQVRNSTGFDPQAVQRRALQIRNRLRELGDEQDSLRARLGELEPWGEFHLPPVHELGHQRLWFYVVPHRQVAAVEQPGRVWTVVSRDQRFAYVVVVSADEPQGMPVERTRAGKRPQAEVRQQLDEAVLEEEDLQAEREGLTRWGALLSRTLSRNEDRAALLDAIGLTHDAAPLFVLQGWAPAGRTEELHRFARGRGVAVDLEGPGEADAPPTLLDNPAALKGGEALVSFYMTPGYWLWDPSTVVFFSFAIFFAMILSDAGYAALLGAALALGWRRLGRAPTGRWLRILFAHLVAASLLWGGAVGSYFGVNPAPGSALAHLKLLDMNDNATMMGLSIGVGVSHVVLANLADAWRRRHSRGALAPLGWVALLCGALGLWWGNSGGGGAMAARGGLWAMGLGAAAVVGFTGGRAPLGRRLLQGLLALTRVSSAFGDVLSYLRLFALGLASASLALAFNDLAGQVAAAAPGMGKLLALLVLLVGHGLNLLLGIASGFIHGLRLNFIEFFNWSVPEEGYPFRPFARKEGSPWSP